MRLGGVLGLSLVRAWFDASGSTPGSTLLNDLVSYWTLDETSGVRYDSVGDNDLTDNNTVGVSLRGPEGTVASFVKANTETLSHPDFADQIDMSQGLTVVWWEKMTVAQTAQVPMKLGNDVYQGAAAFICNDAGAASNYRFISAETGDYAPIAAAIDFPTTELKWHFLAARYLPATKKVSISYDATGQSVSAAGLSAHPVFSNNKPIVWGASCDGVFGLGAVWNRALTDEEEGVLFASGNGLRYADLPAGLKTGLVSWWELDEVSGVRYDSHGSNDLTDNNTVLSAPASAVKFTASNQELRITPYGDVDLSATGFAVAGWFYVANGFPTVSYDDGSGNRVFLWVGSIFYVLDSAGGFQGVAADPPYPQWSHVVLSYDPADKKGYVWINGALKGSTPVLTSGLAYKPNAPFFIGHGGTDGGASEVGFWNRLLTSDERAALAATVHTYDDLSAALKTGLMSWWPLGGGGADVHGGKNLAPSNGPTFQLAAMDGGAASFVAANSEMLTKSPLLTFDQSAHTIAGWAKLNSMGNDIITYLTGNGGRSGVYVYTSGGKIALARYVMYDGGYKVASVNVDIPFDAWFLFVADADGENARISVNNGTPGSAAAGFAVPDTNFPTVLGALAASQNYLDGQLDEVAIWSRVLTDDERAELYAAGAGKFYPFS